MLRVFWQVSEDEREQKGEKVFRGKRKFRGILNQGGEGAW
jgi:hypothetical protein